MQFGLVYPQTEYGNDPAAIRDYAQTAEGLGYSHILAYDHILGANPDRPGGWQGTYTYIHGFQEPLVLFAYMAGLTNRIGFATGIIILPQRETALAAKQAATLDILSGGRLRFGIGLGWNPVEYEAMNEDFHTRGRRIEEQVTLLRKLWTEPLVTFHGRWHTISDAGLNPLPIQRPIPIWFGGRGNQALKRAARLGDGWMTNFPSPAEARPAFDALFTYLEEAGRDPKDFGIEARLPYGNGDIEKLGNLVMDWKAAGATIFSLNTMACGFTSPGEHIRAIERFTQVVGVA